MADVKKIATREAYGEFLVEEGAKRPNLVVMDADLSGSTKTKNFAKAYPERFVNCGISEQDLYAEATGIALSGHVVCASTFAMFAAGRAYEIIRNSIGYTGANVKICATHAGITVGEDGASHQTFEDLSLMREIPGMTVLCPADAVSARKLLEAAVDFDGPAYIRLGRSGVPVLYSDEQAEKIQIGKATQLREGSDVTVIATGILVADAMAAAETLAEEGISARVLDMHTINRCRGNYQGSTGNRCYRNGRGAFRYRRPGQCRGRSGRAERTVPNRDGRSEGYLRRIRKAGRAAGEIRHDRKRHCRCSKKSFEIAKIPVDKWNFVKWLIK